jgi:cellulose synthase (UDP-forming)
MSAAAGFAGCCWFKYDAIHPVGIYLRIFCVCMAAFAFSKYIMHKCFPASSKNERLFWVRLLYSLTGAGILSFLTGIWFSFHPWIILLIWISASLLFCVIQSYQNKKERKFYTYENLYKRIKKREQQKVSKASHSVKITFFFTRMICYLYLGWRFFFTLPMHQGWAAMILAIILLFFEALGVVEYVIGFDIISHQKNYPLPKVDPNLLPDVDVFIATYNEEPSLLYKTIYGAVHMDYPDPNKVHIYVCDDGSRKEVEDLAKRMGVGYFKREDHSGAKAGNLNNALKQTSSPYVVTFDADMIASHNFLMETMPYFVAAEQENEGLAEDEKVELGFIQTPQTFYNPDLFQHNLLSHQRVSNEQDYFYRCIESAKTQSNSVIYGGSNTILSRKALEEVGGFYTEAITEDFATGLLIQKHGYVSLGLSKPLASGLNPEDFESLVSQRVRWGRGVINLLHQMSMLNDPNLSLNQKLNYFISITYWFAPLKRFVFIGIPILSALFHIPVVNCTIEQIFFFWLPMTLLTAYSFHKISGKMRTSAWSNLYETILFPFLMFPILFELFGFSLKKFKVTRKDGGDESKLPFRFFLPYIILLILSVFAIYNCIQELIVYKMSGAGVTLFWLIYNMLLMTLSFIFLSGSVAYKHEDLQQIELEGAIYQADAWQPVKIIGISDTMVSFFSEYPYYLDPKKPSELVLQDLKVQKDGWKPVKISITNSRVISKKDGYIYECFIVAFSNYDQFLHLVYDRPVKSVEMNRKSRLIPSLFYILSVRLARKYQDNYDEPQIQIRKKVPLIAQNKSVYIDSFFWNHLIVSGKDLPETLSFQLSDTCSYIVQAKKAKRLSINTYSYQVKDLPLLFKHPRWYQDLLHTFKK